MVTRWHTIGESGRSPQKAVERGRVRLLICDDHTLFREGLKAILRTDPSIEVVGEAADGKQAVESVHLLHPEMVLMDVSMPKMIGY